MGIRDRVFTSPIVVKLLGSGRLAGLIAIAQKELRQRGSNFYAGDAEGEFFRKVPKVVAGHSSTDVHAALVQLSDFFLEMPPVEGGDYPIFVRNCVKARPKDGELTVGRMHESMKERKLLLGDITLEKFFLCRRVECAIHALGDRAIEMEMLSCEQVCRAILGQEEL